MTRFATAGVALTVLAGFAVGASGFLPRPEFNVRWRVAALDETDYRPGASVGTGRELVLVFLGSSRCPWTNRPDVVGAVRDAKSNLAKVLADTGIGFATEGVTNDPLVADGIEHLRQFGDFDEISVGRESLNAAVRKYVYEDLRGPSHTPQLLVIERTITLRGERRAIEGERVLLRKIGARRILDWVERGSPVPGLLTSSTEAVAPG